MDNQKSEEKLNEKRTSDWAGLTWVLVFVVILTGLGGYYYWSQTPRAVVASYIRSVQNGSPDKSKLGDSTVDDVLAPYVVLAHEILTTQQIGPTGLKSHVVRARVTYQTQGGAMRDNVVTFRLTGPKIGAIE